MEKTTKFQQILEWDSYKSIGFPPELDFNQSIFVGIIGGLAIKTLLDGFDTLYRHIITYTKPNGPRLGLVWCQTELWFRISLNLLKESIEA